MDKYDFLIRVGLALGLGLLIGLQREQAAADAGALKSIGGVRTYSICALVGALAGLLAGLFGAWVLVAALLAMSVPVALSYADDLKRERDPGATSEVAFIATFLIGALCGVRGLIEPVKQQLFLASTCGIAVAALLSAKAPLHTFASKISKEDVTATLKFLVLAGVILPVLPNQDYGPLGAFNPFSIGLMIVLIAGVSFVGYVAIRTLGVGKGVGVTGLLGGLASSTAVTLSFSSRARSTPGAAGALAPAVVLACTVMFLRVLVELAIVNWSLMLVLALPIGLVALVGLAAAGILFLRSRKESVDPQELRLSNPFEIGSAVKFGLLFAVVLLVSKLATTYLGARGGYAASILAGTTDVDAITLSMARLARQGLDPRQAATSILLACASNTLVKAGMTVVVGRWLFGRRAGVALAVMALGAGGAIAALWLLPGFPGAGR